MRAIIDGAGRIVLPKAIREQAGLKAGTAVEISCYEGRIEIAPSTVDVRLVTKGFLTVAEPIDRMPTVTLEILNREVEALRGDREGR